MEPEWATSIIKLELKSCQHRYREPDPEKLIKCLRDRDLENLNRGRTDKEGCKDKAREDDKLTESSDRDLKEDDTEGNMVCLPKSKEFEQLRNLLQEASKLNMRERVLALNNMFRKCNLNRRSECTDQHLQPEDILCSGENEVDGSLVPKALRFTDQGLEFLEGKDQSYTDGRVSLKEKEVIVHHKQDLGPILSVNAIVAASQMLANVTDVDYAGPYCLLCLPHLDSFALCQLPESSISIRLYGLNGM
jgi:hypothetical protein